MARWYSQELILMICKLGMIISLKFCLKNLSILKSFVNWK